MIMLECPSCPLKTMSAYEYSNHPCQEAVNRGFLRVRNGFGGTTTVRQSARQPVRPVVPVAKPRESSEQRMILAARRLNIPYAVALRVADRDVNACQSVVDSLQGQWDESPSGSCCKPIIQHADHYPPACEHLLRLWKARSYLELAQAKAPTDRPAFPCTCRGSGKFYSGGAVVNGNYTGTIGKCFRCGGKGWQSEADRKRNSYYDNNVRRITL